MKQYTKKQDAYGTMTKLAELIKKSFKNGTYDSVKLHAELLRLLITVDRNTLADIVSALDIACNEYCDHIEEFGSDV